MVNELFNYNPKIDCQDRWGGTPLIDAVREGHRGVMKILLEHKAELELTGTDAASMLCDFTQQGDIDKTVQLLDAGCPVNANDYDGRTALHLACCEGNMQIVQKLIERGADFNPKDRWGGTPLADAVREGHSKVAKLIYTGGGELGFDETRATSELCASTRKGDLENVVMLLEAGCPVNAEDYDKRTALHLACSDGNLKMVNELFNYNPKIDCQDRWGGTPLGDAVREGHIVVAAALVAKGATFNFEENKAAGELCELANQGDIERVKLMILGKCDPRALDYDHRSALHLAASAGTMHVLRLLISHGVEPNSIDRWGGTPLADAVRHHHRQCAMELVRVGGKLCYDEAKASSELCELARAGDIEGIRLLIDCGIDMGAADYDGRTVVHLAASLGHKHIVDFLAMRKCMDLASKDRWGGTALDDAKREGHTKLEEALRSYFRVLEHR